MTHLVAEASVAATDALLIARAHGEAHDAVETRSTGLARGHVCGVGVVVKVGGGGATYVGVAANSVFPDCVGAVEGEEGKWAARGFLSALHLQDCTESERLFACKNSRDWPLAVASRAILLDLFR